MISLVNGDAVAIPLAPGSVNLIVTSPPYFGLRRYDAGPGEIGSEPTPAEFVEALRAVAQECWRVLTDTGVLVINLGDSYGHGTDAARQPGDSLLGQATAEARGIARNGLLEGSRIGIPWRVALALMDDGWTLRQEVIWQKLSAMPESVSGWTWTRHRVRVAQDKTTVRKSATNKGSFNEVGGNEWERDAYPPIYADCPGCPTCAPNDGLILRKGSWRPTTAHEQIFVFVKSMGYFGDGVAVKTEAKRGAAGSTFTDGKTGENGLGRVSLLEREESTTANPRSVMTFKATNYGGAHYATFPTTLPEFFIRAYTPEAGVCSECGEPYARIVTSPIGGTTGKSWRSDASEDITKGKRDEGRGAANGWENDYIPAQSLGFRRTCTHSAPARAAVVLDPFVGSGSTLIAARQIGRSGIGIDLSSDYLVNQARERLGLNAVDAWTNGRKVETDLTGLPMFAPNGAAHDPLD